MNDKDRDQQSQVDGTEREPQAPETVSKPESNRDFERVSVKRPNQYADAPQPLQRVDSATMLHWLTQSLTASTWRERSSFKRRVIIALQADGYSLGQARKLFDRLRADRKRELNAGEKPLH